MEIIYPSICLKFSYMYVPALVFIHFAQCTTKHANFYAVQYFLQFGYSVKKLKSFSWEPLSGATGPRPRLCNRSQILSFHLNLPFGVCHLLLSLYDLCRICRDRE